jgi:hypothetical protein
MKDEIRKTKTGDLEKSKSRSSILLQRLRLPENEGPRAGTHDFIFISNESVGWLGLANNLK